VDAEGEVVLCPSAPVFLPSHLSLMICSFGNCSPHKQEITGKLILSGTLSRKSEVKVEIVSETFCTSTNFPLLNAL